MNTTCIALYSYEIVSTGINAASIFIFIIYFVVKSVRAWFIHIMKLFYIYVVATVVSEKCKIIFHHMEEQLICCL